MFFFFSMFVILLMIIILNAKIQVQIQNFKISTDKKENENFKKEYKIKASIYFLKKIKLWEIEFSKDKLKKSKMKRNISNLEEKIKYSKDKKKINKKIIQIIKSMNIDIKKIDLKIAIGLTNYALNAVSIGLISILISLFIKKIQSGNDIYWKVFPLYNNKNLIKIDFNCIFCIKVLHIIYMIYVISKEGERKNGRSSNRRNYAYNNE